MAKAQRGKAHADWKGRQWYDEKRKELEGRVRREVKQALREHKGKIAK